MEPRIHQDAIDEAEAARAFHGLRDEMNALRPDELRTTAMEIDYAVRLALGAVRHMVEYRSLIHEMPEFEHRYFEQLPVFALAAWHAARHESARTRMAAWTLLYRAYDQCRRVMTYLRWYEEDTDDVMPAFGPAPTVRSMQ